MSLIFITGTSTSGKSAVAKELSKRGYEVYDTEHNGISAWYNKETNKRAANFGEMPERTKAWLNQHEWRISTDWVGQIADKAKSKPIFLCGGAANELEILKRCECVIWLKTNETVIQQRVALPRDHDYGTRPHELALAIEENKKGEAKYKAYGAAMIDATKPLKTVVNRVLIKVNL